MITTKDVEHIGWLARLKIKEEQLEGYAGQLNSVIDYFGQLDEVDTKEVEPTYHVLEMNNVFRDDKVTDCLSQDEAIGNAPKTQDSYFKAPRII
ncbi:MAG: aspartyl-tRNA(Asn)/glutamyl-tRNA(Gln) amidotransferase subunit C [ANME-2 cluster archaeon]|nr:aspartyl-tRNA(Asn)/glutamyl-tRNA(Gln) amidotransferase subunit C [ANME-2 cluster archaeon]